MTEHVCGQDRMEASYCLSCGCWGDTHPGAGSGYDCVCTNLHYEGFPSQDEQREQRKKEKGHYIARHEFASHYCSTPQEANSFRGEIWQCDVCGTVWKFRESLFERACSFTGRWKKTR